MPPGPCRRRTPHLAVAAALTLGLLTGVSPISTAASTASAAAASTTNPSGSQGRPHLNDPSVQIKTTGSATWTSDSFTAGTGASYAVTGEVSGPGARRVELQYRSEAGWQPLQVGHAVDGAFAFTGPWEWHGNHQVRVVATETKRYQQKVLDRHQIVVDLGYEPRGATRDYELMTYLGRRIRMNPCQTVRWRLNAAGVGPQVRPVIEEALARVEQASGVHFEYAGPSHQIALNSRGLVSDTNLLISWATQRQRPELAGKVALSQMIKRHPARDREGRVWAVTQTGITFNTDVTTGRGAQIDLGVDSRRRATLAMVVMHEVGHALGLGHVQQTRAGRAELMFYSIAMLPWPDGQFRARYGRGDLAGLDRVGYGAGCLR